MKRASNDTVIGVQSLLDPIAQVVNSAAFGQDQQLRRPETWHAMLDNLEHFAEPL